LTEHKKEINVGWETRAHRKRKISNKCRVSKKEEKSLREINLAKKQKKRSHSAK
jgi:hypothetical protein